MRPGPRNLVTDIAGLRVGQASDARVKTGVTVLSVDVANVASAHVMGGAPGTRDTELLAPENTVEGVDAFVLSGGSAFGLDAAGGVQAALAGAGRGFEVAGHRVPIVPCAILFDLANGGEKEPFGTLYRDLGRAAAEDLCEMLDLGSHGAGTGASTGGENGTNAYGLKGGIGSASMILERGITVAALVAANPVGAPCDADGRFHAAPFEFEGEFGGRGISTAPLDGPLPLKMRAAPGGNTTIGIVATDATLTKAQAKRLAVAAHDGIARAVWPAHTPLDGDLLFAVATNAKPAPDLALWLDMGAAAQVVVARSIARAVFATAPAPNDIVPAWTTLHG